MSSEFSFIHCADLHLGGRFSGIMDRDRTLGKRLTQCTLDSFSRIVDAALERGVDFMVISGDVYDSENPLPSTRAWFVRELERFGGPCFICRGNHDSYTPWDSAIPYPSNVHEFGTEPESIQLECGAEVVGVSFSKPHETSNLASLLKGSSDWFTVACVHCDVGSVSEGDVYAPCEVRDLRGRGVQYWALGHIHKRQVLSEEPCIVYPGNIQGRNPKEVGEKGAYLVSVHNQTIMSMEFLPTQGAVWHDLVVDISGKGLQDLVSEISGHVKGGDVVRITTIGCGVLDGMLRSQTSDVMTTLSQSIGCTVDSIQVRSSPDIDLDERAGIDDVVGRSIAVARSTAGSGREAILNAILSHPVASVHGEFYRSMTDEELEGMVDDALMTLLQYMGVGR